MNVLTDTNIAFDNDNGYGDYTEQREELLQAPFSQILQQGLKEHLGV